MTLGQLVNLEQEKLADEHRKLLDEIAEYLPHPLRRAEHPAPSSATTADELKRKHADARRTEISGEEIGEVDLEDLIDRRDDGRLDHAATATSSARRPASTAPSAAAARASTGAKTDEEDPIEHLFVASTHDYLLFFTNKGKVYWQKVYDLPQLARESRGRAVVNLLNLAEGETDRRLPRRPRFRPARPLPDDGHRAAAW